MDVEDDNVGPDFESMKKDLPNNMTLEDVEMMEAIYFQHHGQNDMLNAVDHNAKKLIDCPREIVFKLEGTVYNQNSKQEVIATEAIFDQSYHIPVPSGVNYQEYIQYFINHFVSCLEKTASQSTYE